MTHSVGDVEFVGYGLGKQRSKVENAPLLARYITAECGCDDTGNFKRMLLSTSVLRIPRPMHRSGGPRWPGHAPHSTDSTKMIFRAFLQRTDTAFQVRTSIDMCRLSMVLAPGDDICGIGELGNQRRRHKGSHFVSRNP